MKKGQIIFGLCYIVVQMLILPLILSILNVLLHSPLTIAELNFVCFAVNFIVLTVVYRNFLFASAQVISKTFGRYIGITISGFVLYWLSSYLINILFSWYQSQRNYCSAVQSSVDYIAVTRSSHILFPLLLSGCCTCWDMWVFILPTDCCFVSCNIYRQVCSSAGHTQNRVLFSHPF